MPGPADLRGHEQDGMASSAARPAPLPGPCRDHRRITVELDSPCSNRVALALALLIEEINVDPPAMPGDGRLISYRLSALGRL